MMTDENIPDSKVDNTGNTPESVDKKGQMLVIYLPEGSVIVDRTDMNLSSAPTELMEKVTATLNPVPEVEVAPAKETALLQTQLTFEEVVQMAVQEALRTTGLSTPKQSPVIETRKEILPAVETVVQAPPVETHVQEPYPLPKRKPAPARHVAIRRKRNWVHEINTAFVVYLVTAVLIPSVLSAGFGLALYASKVSHPAVAISTGDMMLVNFLPISSVKAGDVLLMRDGSSWNLDTREVVSNSTAGSLTTLTTSSTGKVPISSTSVMSKDEKAYKVTRVIPKLGYVPMVLTSALAKFLGAFFVLMLNMVFMYRRSRRRRLEQITQSILREALA